MGSYPNGVFLRYYGHVFCKAQEQDLAESKDQGAEEEAERKYREALQMLEKGSCDPMILGFGFCHNYSNELAKSPVEEVEAAPVDIFESLPPHTNPIPESGVVTGGFGGSSGIWYPDDGHKTD